MDAIGSFFLYICAACFLVGAGKILLAASALNLLATSTICFIVAIVLKVAAMPPPPADGKGK